MIARLNVASATGPNWLKEAQETLLAAENPSGLLGALHFARFKPGSLKTILAKTQSAAASLALTVQNNAQSANELMIAKANAAAQQRMADKLAMSQKFNPKVVNYTPPKGLDPIVYFANGATLDTNSQIMTLSSGQQIDIRTGKEYIDEANIVRLASGAYIDTAKKIMVLANGARIDTVTGLSVTA